MIQASVRAEEPGAEWYVTNGQRWIGPVEMPFVLRGIATGSIDPGCLAWQKSWSGWRPLSSVREIRSLEKMRASRRPGWVPPPSYAPVPSHRASLARAGAHIAGGVDEREIVTLTLQAIVRETRAKGGMAHFPTTRFDTLVTLAVSGIELSHHLGNAVGRTDPAMRMARLGPSVIARPESSRRGIASLERFDATYDPIRGVAVAPIYSGTGLVAMLEIAKGDHPFRLEDPSWLRAVTRVATSRLMKLAWARHAS
jgi:hypothetical protein